MSRLAQTMMASERRRREARRRPYSVELIEFETPNLWDDMRVFVLTFVGGFLFMTVYLA